MNNIFEKLKIPEGMRLTKQRTSYNEAFEAIQAEYDKLCPRPSEFPNGYEWFSIDADGQGLYWATKPEISCDCWINVTSRLFYPKDIQIPVGLDWRLCRWSIDDAKRIHGDK